MNILISDLTNLINSYEKYRELANSFGKVIIMRNEKPDAVLLTCAEYEKLSKAYEETDNFNRTDICELAKRLPPRGNKEVYTLAQLKHDLNDIAAEYLDY